MHKRGSEKSSDVIYRGGIDFFHALENNQCEHSHKKLFHLKVLKVKNHPSRNEKKIRRF